MLLSSPFTYGIFGVFTLENEELKGATALTDTNIYNDIHKQFEFRKQIVLADKILTNDEKTYAIRLLTKNICENCKKECLATLYCEYCVRNYLKKDFSNWTSGNDVIDNLIQKCQLETTRPNVIVEWIPHSNLENINYLTKGGFSEIYIARWIDGTYNEWDSEKKTINKI
ncbi:hypothetical protein RhiirA5_435001 [Rhizophagus irregularis]|uniref:Protein kinase domain-containing protein n=1 Tax=Rhizophagus irregularis TaxID=588596 RepID=A0A2N0NP55_9GLOM|nr:hypothetical protein RhiirA5_435001 [Rhizophagus irregularis]